MIWTVALDKSFEELKASLSQATLLADPDSTSTLALVTDASNTAMGAVLQQRSRTYVSRSPYSPENGARRNKNTARTTGMLAIYETVRHIRHML
jgi:hypothetical protein